jgi:hypothetical protein
MHAREECRGRTRVVARAAPNARPVTCASPLNTFRCSRNGSSAFIVGRNSKFAPTVFGVHRNGLGLLSQAPTIPFGV